MTKINIDKTYETQEHGDKTYYSISAEMGRVEKHELCLDEVDWEEVASYVKDNETEHCNLYEIIYEALKEQYITTDITDEYLDSCNGREVVYDYKPSVARPESKLIKDDETAYSYELHLGKGTAYVLGERDGDEVTLLNDAFEDEIIRFCSYDFLALHIPESYYNKLMELM